MSTPEIRSFCETTCQALSKAGYTIKRVQVPIGFGFMLRAPSGKTLFESNITERSALFDLCQAWARSPL